ncbi:MAG: Lrp/AsnC family transcriptional regulator [Candidatus Nanohaloarchaea archaeon]|nr:Lrp/AsnC family transcriptional regulator [Candidatus Nanohaloarchaea archaeon]
MNVKTPYQRILHQLEEDARQSFTAIGDAAGVSQQTVSYAVDRMEEDGIIRGYYPLFDYTKFGYNGYVGLFRVNTFSQDRMDELTALFREHEMVAWVSRLAGGWDLLVFFLAPNASYFNKQFKQLVSQHPEQLQTSTILTTVVIHDMERTYLSPDASDYDTHDTIIGGDRDVFDLSGDEEATCEVLFDDPTQPSVRMGEQLDVTAKTVIDRIDRLEEQTLVKGYRPLLGLPQLDIIGALLFASVTNKEVDEVDDLVDYCSTHPNITLLMKTFGDWDVMIRVETESREQRQTVIQELRERFEHVILDYTTLEVVDDVEKRYLPPGHFDPDAFLPVQE